MTKIAFATCRNYPHPATDDLHASRELERLGIEVVSAIWDQRLDWSEFDGVVIRSTWDYWLKIDAFVEWLESLQKQEVPVWNSVPTILGNLNKTYLGEFPKRGLPIVPTHFVKRGDYEAIRKIAEAEGDFIAKPVISGGSYRTHRLSRRVLADARAELESIWEVGPAMIQPCLPAIFSEGEYSYVFFGGEFSHAIRKHSSNGDFRIQVQYGGKNERVYPSDREVQAARRYLAGRPEVPLYARVDLVRHDGELVLMELELTEPSLFFSEAPESAARFARVLADRLSD